jgi:hypothetical protein
MLIKFNDERELQDSQKYKPKGHKANSIKKEIF